MIKGLKLTLKNLELHIYLGVCIPNHLNLQSLETVSWKCTYADCTYRYMSIMATTYKIVIIYYILHCINHYYNCTVYHWKIRGNPDVIVCQ